MFGRKRKQNDFSAEIEAHIENEAERLRELGWGEEEAKAAARRTFGNVMRAEEGFYERRHWMWWDELKQDVKFGVRMLAKVPGFTSIVVLTLALGIGANTAIFSLVDWLVLRPIPGVQNAGRLAYLITERKEGGQDNGFSYPNFEDIRKQTSSVFSYVSGFMPFQMDGLRADGNTMQIWTNYVTGDFFEALGVKPAVGRLILPSEAEVAGKGPVLVLSYSYWQSHFGGDPGVAGKKVEVNGQPVTIVGVTPKSFHGSLAILDTQGYLPLSMAGATLRTKSDFLVNRGVGSDMLVIALLKTGVSLAEAQPVLKVVADRLSHDYPSINKWASLRAVELTSEPPGAGADASRPLVVISRLFLFLAGMVLLLACMNVANLQLVRAHARSREMAARAALGAGRGRLIRQMLTESNLLALLGCTGGIVLGMAGTKFISTLNLGTAIPIVLDFSFNWRVFTYAVAAALLAGIVVGIIPALRVARGNLREVLHEGGRTATGGRQRLRTALVVAQVAGSLMLLIVAGLFVRSLENVQKTNLGFDPSHVLNISMDPTEAGYGEVSGTQFLHNLVERVRGLAGVQSASLAASVPAGLYSYGAELKVAGYQPAEGEDTISAGENAVSPGYFKTMGIPLVEGRDFLDSDEANAPPVAIINETMAKRYWPGQDAVGRQFTILADPDHPVQVVGVAKDSSTGDVSEKPRPYVYLAFAQKYLKPATLQVRTAGAPEAMASGIVEVIRSMEPAMPTFDVQTMKQALYSLNGLMLYQIGAGLAAALGILGLMLAIVGVYGVVSYSATQRTHEIGIRRALGAQPGHVLKMILRQGVLIVCAGLVAGILAALGISRMVGGLLFGLGGMDPFTYAVVSVVLGGVALMACYIPARRAMRVDPMVALRHE